MQDKIDKLTDTMERRIFDLESENTQLKAEIVDLKKSSETMKEQLKNTTKTVKQVRAHAVANEQYSRKSNIKILGLPENKELEKVDSKILVLDFLKEILDIDLDIGEVDAAHSIGKPDKNRNRSLSSLSKEGK